LGLVPFETFCLKFALRAEGNETRPTLVMELSNFLLSGLFSLVKSLNPVSNLFYPMRLRAILEQP
jgi:hypothetical protein